MYKTNNNTIRYHNKSCNVNSLNIVYANAGGLNMKKHSLKHEIKECEAAKLTIQETNFKSKEDF